MTMHTTVYDPAVKEQALPTVVTNVLRKLLALPGASVRTASYQACNTALECALVDVTVAVPCAGGDRRLVLSVRWRDEDRPSRACHRACLKADTPEYLRVLTNYMLGEGFALRRACSESTTSFEFLRGVTLDEENDWRGIFVSLRNLGLPLPQLPV